MDIGLLVESYISSNQDIILDPEFAATCIKNILANEKFNSWFQSHSEHRVKLVNVICKKFPSPTSSLTSLVAEIDKNIWHTMTKLILFLSLIHI